MKLRIAFVTDPTTGEIDTKRVGGIEDVPDDEAKRMIRDGQAAIPTDDEIAAFELAQSRAAELRAAELEPLTKSEIRDQYPAAAELPPSASKAELIDAAVGPSATDDGTAEEYAGDEPDDDPASTD